MKKLIFIFMTIGLVVIDSCKKDTVTDPIAQYLGTYSYTATTTGGLVSSVTSVFTITKQSPTTIGVNFQNNPSMYFTVDGNSITEVKRTVYLTTVGGTSVPFVENSTGSINGKSLVINGTLYNVNYQLINMNISATKQ
jgi:hypothetical protein